MTTIKTRQLVKYNGHSIPLPKVGERMTNKNGDKATVTAVRVVGKPYGGMLNGAVHYGLIQEYEMDLH